ncbi:hypothetical protein C9426_22465 [Serratia sp. S1B]|nr:hypothetical protein C9426_22465 [Serratia sp. S1B]
MRYSARFLDKDQDEWDHEYSLSEVDINPFPFRADERARVLVYENDVPIMLLHVFIEIDKEGCLLDSCFSGLLCNEQYVAIMLGQHIHLFEIASQKFRSLYLDDFVGHIYSVPDCLNIKLSENFLVTTFCYVFLVNVVEGITWKSPMCGIDGVIISNISDGII